MQISKDQIELIESSALFDAEWYRHTHPDVAFSGMSEAEHYVKIGARIGRDPSPKFDASAYLARYLDVAARGDVALLHFESHGRNEQRVPCPAPIKQDGVGPASVDVVLPVYNALEDVRACLHSLAGCETRFLTRVIVINDGSDAETTAMLRDTCPKLTTDRIKFDLIEHDGNLGYTTTVNTGFAASDAAYVVTLNSDTIVTPFWLDGLVRCMASDPALGIVGPLSNAASWQNVPELLGPDGKFAINALPEGHDPAQMAAIVSQASIRAYPRAPFVNGFCFMIRRAVLDAIGHMDVGTFPVGYGEENDFCIRAQDAGFALAYADDTYVFHAKSKSFGDDRRAELSKAGSMAIRAKHGETKFADLLKQVKKTGPMDRVRDRVRAALAATSVDADAVNLIADQKILFLLPVGGGSGGAHSVVQEAWAMRAMGIEAKVAIRQASYDNFINLYSDVPGVEDLFIGFVDETLVDEAQEFDVVVATIFNSVMLLKRIISVCPWILPAYYAQDYEPLFFDEGSANWHEARRSYGAIPNAVVMAKTHWICREIETRHGVLTHKIEPSIDHTVYNPIGRKTSETICVAAMIRPRTPRRGAGRTMELLAKLKARHGERLQVRIFGCREEDDDFKALRRDFDFENAGVLTRPQVADLLRSADVFIDLSDYQAFGRTGLEAMACGALSVVPEAGGGDEYAVDGGNALVVDSFDVDTCLERLSALIEQPREMARMRLAGMATSARYSPRRAAMSELLTFAPALAAHRAVNPKPVRPKLLLLPALTTKNPVTITGSGYVRLLAPYHQEELIKSWQTRVIHDGSLPEPGSADVVILQRDLKPDARDLFEGWRTRWRDAGGRLVYEVDDDLMDVSALCQRGFDQPNAEALARRVQAYAHAADRITVSTGRLAEVFGALGPNMAAKIDVIPNYLDRELWRLDEPPKQNEVRERRPLKLGYVGTPTHTEDLMLIRDVIVDLEASGAVEVEVVGAFQRSEPLFGKRIGLPRTHTYPIFVEWLPKVADWDIVVIPIADNSFNKAKSYLKFLDCATLNAAIVCSDTPEYRLVGRDGENCLMVANDPKNWKAALERLIQDGPLRHRLAAQARRDLSEKWTVQKNIASYTSMLRNVLNRAG